MRPRLQSVFIICIYAAIDVACIVLAFYLVLLFRPQTMPFKVSFSSLFSAANPFKQLFLIWTLLIVFFHYTHGLYHTRREQLESLEIGEVVKSIVISTLVVIVLAFLMRVHDFPRSVMILNAVVITAFCSIWRVFKKLLVNYLVSNGYNNFNTLIVGAGKTGILLAGEINSRPALGLKIKGFLDDNKAGHCGDWLVLGRLESLREIIHREFIHKIFITIYPDHESFIKLLEIARDEGLAVRVVPQGYEYMADDFVKYNIGIIPILEYSDIDISYRQNFKRVFDFVLSFLAMIFLLPVFIVLGCLSNSIARGLFFITPADMAGTAGCLTCTSFVAWLSMRTTCCISLKTRMKWTALFLRSKKTPGSQRWGLFYAVIVLMNCRKYLMC